MPNNQYKNKVVYNGNTLIDLTGDTVSASDVAQGVFFHLPTGEPAVGTASGSNLSTATMTIINDTYVGGSARVPIAVDDSGDEIAQAEPYIDDMTTTVLDVILYEGSAYLHMPEEIFGEQIISISGDIEDDGDGYYIITGNCAMTIEQPAYYPIHLGTLIPNSYVDHRTGDLITYNGWSRTNYIDISNAASLTVRSSASSIYNVFFTANYAFIGNFTVKTSDATVEVPSNAAYMILSNTDQGMANFVGTWTLRT